MTKHLSRAIGGAIVATGILSGGALAADVGTYAYPPPPPGSPVYAPVSMVTGDIAAAVGYWSDSYDAAGEILGAGRVNFPLQGGSNWYVTAEVFGAAAFFDPTETAILGALHAYHKTEQYAHGVYISAQANSWGGYSQTAFGGGVEGAAFMGNTTLVGRLGYYGAGGDFAPPPFWSAEAIARFYVNPNTKLAGIAAWQSDPGLFMLAGGIEHLFAGSNISGLGRIAWFNGEGGYNAWELMVGAKMMFGRPGTTLQQHDWDIPFAEATAINF